MNRYLVTIDRRHHSVEASNSRVAINRALRGFEQRQTVTIDCSLQERNIVRVRREKQSHGRAWPDPIAIRVTRAE